MYWECRGCGHTFSMPFEIKNGSSKIKIKVCPKCASTNIQQK